MKRLDLIRLLLAEFEQVRPRPSMRLLHDRLSGGEDVDEALAFLLRSNHVSMVRARDVTGAWFSAPLMELTPKGRLLLSELRASASARNG